MFHCIVRQLPYLSYISYLPFEFQSPSFCISTLFRILSPFMCAKHLLEFAFYTWDSSFNNKRNFKKRCFRGYIDLYWWTILNFYVPLAELKSLLWCISSTSCPRAVLLHLLLLWSTVENLNWCITPHTAFHHIFKQSYCSFKVHTDQKNWSQI